MIHQLIFANPKPGMSVAEFQDYWLNTHAVKFAAKIPQIVRYKIDTVIPFWDEKPLYNGIAEIWLKNEKEQLESLQSQEYLEGARRDEPNWAAFWETIGLDTETRVILEGDWLKPQPDGIKMVILVKRREGMPLNAFRQYSFKAHSLLVRELPGLKGYIQCHVRDGLYAVGEPRFDCVSQLWFENLDLLQNTLASEAYQAAVADLQEFVEMKYLFKMICNEHWIIGPEFKEIF